MNVLQVENIRKSFGKLEAVGGISFSVGEGVIYGLLGPNGAGKTTTIRMIMNIIVPDAGRISILGEANLKKASDQVGYLPEERGIYRKMKTGEVLLFLCRLKSMPDREARKEIDRWLERMELSSWKNKKVEELSKGMQQKLQLIGTLIHRPRLLILDEPFMGLDPINTNLVKNILLEFRESGTSIIFSTHLMENAEKLCGEIFLINKGKEVLSGTLSEVKKRFGNQNLFIEYEGNVDFLKASKSVRKIDQFGNSVEIQLTRDADTQSLLREAIKSCQIRRFEIREPSLNDIFIDSVAQANGLKGGRTA